MSDHGPNCECRGCEHAELERLRAELATAKNLLDMQKQEREDALLATCIVLEQERDEARAATRHMVTVLANGDSSVVERAIREYPWLEEASDD